MFQRINQYLLTHYPLLWNTRVVWVLSANLVIHLLFLISGLTSVSAKTFAFYNVVEEVGGFSLYSFSVLCSLLVLILWLVYYLRNNAFKSFYRISKWHLAKEFVIILLIMLTTVTYFESYNWGVRLKVRSITSLDEFREEVNTANLAQGFIPTNRGDYFILNNCSEKKKKDYSYRDPDIDTLKRNVNIVTIGPDSVAQVELDSIEMIIREGLRRPDAFSYMHFCERRISGFEYGGLLADEEISANQVGLISAGNRDSIHRLIQDFLKICKKYAIPVRINAGSLVSQVFARPQNNISGIIPTSQYTTDQYNNAIQNKYYVETGSLSSVYDFIDESLPNRDLFEKRRWILTVEAYIALCASILLLCYRRFSRKVFLISIVGILVWSILIGLFVAGAGGSASAFAVFCILLWISFGLIGWANLKTRSSKTLTGVVFNWHIYLTPFIIHFLLLIVQDYYDDRSQSIINQSEDEYMQLHYPFSFWVTNHIIEIVIVNFFLVLVYTAWLFNRWAKKWQVMAEE